MMSFSERCLMENLVRPSQKFAPFSKIERQKRRAEVFKLHIEYGYSAVKIAELLKVNRNTINNDIKWCYNQVRVSHPGIIEIFKRQLYRHETQRQRLRAMLDIPCSMQERLAVERLIFELDSRLGSMVQKTIDFYQLVIYQDKDGPDEIDELPG